MAFWIDGCKLRLCTQRDPETAERFLVNEPKQEFALKADHDKQDYVELPKFMNLPSDQGIGRATSEEIEEIKDEPVVPLEKSRVSSTKDDDVPKEEAHATILKTEVAPKGKGEAEIT